MSSPLDCNGVAAAREAIRYLSHPETPWSDEQVGAVINAYFAAAKTAEERKRRAAGPSSVKWPMPDPLAKYKALAPSQTAVEPVARFNPVLDTEDGGYGFVTMKQSEHGQWVPLSTLTAQAAALVAAEKERGEAWGDLSKVAGAIGSVRFMDPPDGGDVTLAEQVARMREALEAAESEVATLKGRVAELEAGLEPFAKHLDEMKFDRDNNGNELPDDQSVGWVYVTNGDFRRARRLTHQEKNNG